MVNEGQFVWEGDAADAEEAFLEFLAENFDEGSYKLLEFKESEDQSIPENIKKSLN